MANKLYNAPNILDLYFQHLKNDYSKESEQPGQARPVNQYSGASASIVVINRAPQPYYQPFYAAPIQNTIQIINGPVDSKAKKEERENDRATTAAIVGAVGVVTLSVAKAFYDRAKENNGQNLTRLQEALTIREGLQSGALPVPPDGLNLRTITQINKADLDILEEKTSRIRDLGWAISVGIGCSAAALIGGMLSVQWLITASIVVGVATLALGAYATVWHCTANTNMPRDLLAWIEDWQPSNFANQPGSLV